MARTLNKDTQLCISLAARPSNLGTRFHNYLYEELDLNYVYKGLSVAGENGGLKNRFSGANAVARGHVTGKVGHIDIEYSLAGIVDAADGTQLSFAFFAIGDVGEGAKAALDTLTTAVYNCGANLSNK